MTNEQRIAQLEAALAALRACDGPTLLEAMTRFLEQRGEKPTHAYWSHLRYFDKRFPGASLAHMAKIGAYLGHSSPGITSKYSHLNPDSLAEVVAAIGGAPPPAAPPAARLPLVLAPPPPPRRGGLRLLG